MKYVYVIRKDPDWDSDFILVCATREIAAKTIANLAWEEELVQFDDKDLVSEMKTREAHNALYCLFKTKNEDNYSILVQKVPIENTPVSFE